MSTLSIIGAQWGDEAKGKIADFLTKDAEYVVRFSGGNNAGHTVYVGDLEFKFHTLPAGILHENATAILGGGMVICPKSLLGELKNSQQSGVKLGKLLISDRAHVVFPFHNMLDSLEEEARGKNKIGTTSRGIGPAYQDKVSRIGIRMGEFVNPEKFKERFQEVLKVKNRMLVLFGKEPLHLEPLLEEYLEYAEQLKPYVCNTNLVIQNALDQNKKIIFEGAQGTFLDLDLGTYPYVTSSHPTSAGVCIGTGVGPKDLHSIIGVCKAYSTRVGSGPFPTELLDEMGDKIREQGKEFGVTTGRDRRCGWLDLVVLKQSCRINSLTGLVLTRLDILSDLGPIQTCVGYDLNGEKIEHMPMTVEELNKVKPIYKQMEGWTGNLRKARKWEDLPTQVHSYVKFIEEYTGVPVVILSIGPEREETIILREDLIWNN